MIAERSRRSSIRRILGRPVPAVWLGVAALLGALTVMVAERLPGPGEAPAQLESKGSVDLLVYARSDERVMLLDRFNRSVHEGSEIRFVLTGVPDEHTHLMVASVDANGKASIYYPYEGRASAQLPGPGRWEVPGSIVLDGTPGPERVFALFSRAPLDARVVRAALTRAAAGGPNAIRDLMELGLPGTTQRSFLMFKVAQK